MEKYIHVFDDKTKEELLEKGYHMVKSTSQPYIFRNELKLDNAIFNDNSKIMFSDVMYF